MQSEKFMLRGGGTALGQEFSALQRHLGLKVGIKAEQNFKHDNPCFASVVRSNCTGFHTLKSIVLNITNRLNRADEILLTKAEHHEGE